LPGTKSSGCWSHLLFSSAPVTWESAGLSYRIATTLSFIATPLPVTRRRGTTQPIRQTEVQVEIYQGEDEDHSRTSWWATFILKLATDGGAERSALPHEPGCDGILHVTASRRKQASRSTSPSHERTARSPSEIAAPRERLEALYSSRGEEVEESSGKRLGGLRLEGEASRAKREPGPKTSSYVSRLPWRLWGSD